MSTPPIPPSEHLPRDHSPSDNHPDPSEARITSPPPDPQTIGIPNIPPRSASSTPRPISALASPSATGTSSPIAAGQRIRPTGSSRSLQAKSPRKVSPTPSAELLSDKATALPPNLSPTTGSSSHASVVTASTPAPIASLSKRASAPRLAGGKGSVSGSATPGQSEISRKSSSAFTASVAGVGPGAGDSGISTPRGVAGSAPGDSGFSSLAEIPNEEKAKVLRRHLVRNDDRRERRQSTPGPGPSSGYDEGEAGKSGISRVSIGGGSIRDIGDNVIEDDERGEDATEDEFEIPYDAPGTDVTHNLYKWQRDQRPTPARSASFSHAPLERSIVLGPTLAHIREPGGFRRNFVVNRAHEQGQAPPPVSRNVVDFLFLYGHFAGEDLNEDEDVDTSDADADADGEAEDEDGFLSPSAAERGGYTREGDAGRLDGRSNGVSRIGQRGIKTRGTSNEREPLLGGANGKRGLSKTRHRRTKSGPAQGTATVAQAMLMLLKGFVGTGILFMARAFFNGGLLFSTIVMLSIAMISLWSFLLLVETYMVVPGSFGDIGGQLYGNWLRQNILASIVISQIGFVAAYTIFIAENLQAFILAVSDCKTFIPTRYLILSELILFLPLALIRNLAKLSGTALIADGFILIGLIYIGAQETKVLIRDGMANVAMFNKDSFPLLIGTAVFAFEGIGLVIPITESMAQPKKFPKLLSITMVLVAVLFAGFGFLGYAAYGSDIQTVVIVNLPQDDKFVQAVQFLYSIAILLSIPLQLFPAVRILENGLFSKSGKHNPAVKWKKNMFRAAVVVATSLLSWAGSNELDKFVSLVGSFACIPLAFIYPAMLHLKACAHTRRQKAIDWGFIIFGSVVGVYTTVQTVRSLFKPSDGPTQFGKCKAPEGF